MELGDHASSSLHIVWLLRAGLVVLDIQSSIFVYNYVCMIRSLMYIYSPALEEDRMTRSIEATSLFCPTVTILNISIRLEALTAVPLDDGCS